MSFNKIILVGNCTKDGELRYSQGGMGIYNNSLAVSRKYTSNGEKKEEVLFVDFTAFARSSEICNQYLRKGSKILVEGRLNFEQWVDQNGQKRSKHSVTVETMQMLDSKGDNQSNNGQANQAHQQGQQQQYQPQQRQSNQANQPTYEYQNAQGQQMPPPNRQAPQQQLEIDTEDNVPF